MDNDEDEVDNEERKILRIIKRRVVTSLRSNGSGRASEGRNQEKVRES